MSIMHYLIKNGNFCYSDFYNVFCVKADGTPLFSYKSSELQNPQKITSDSHGNIYIIGYLSSNVHRLSSDGGFIDIILKKENGLDRPRALYFNRRYTKLFLSKKDGKVISVFNSKWLFRCRIHWLIIAILLFDFTSSFLFFSRISERMSCCNLNGIRLLFFVIGISFR